MYRCALYISDILCLLIFMLLNIKFLSPVADCLRDTVRVDSTPVKKNESAIYTTYCSVVGSTTLYIGASKPVLLFFLVCSVFNSELDWAETLRCPNSARCSISAVVRHQSCTCYGVFSLYVPVAKCAVHVRKSKTVMVDNSLPLLRRVVYTRDLWS